MPSRRRAVPGSQRNTSVSQRWTMAPLAMTAISSATPNARWRSCSTSSTAVPAAAMVLIDEHGREALRRFVEHDDGAAGDEAASDREHLLLAAGQQAGELAPALREARE